MSSFKVRKAAFAAAAVFASVGMVAPVASATTQHCDFHDATATTDTTAGEPSAVKIEVQGNSASETVQVPNLSSGALSDVTITIDGADLTLEGEGFNTANWCIKSARNVNYGSGLEGTSASENSNAKVQNISYVVIYDVTNGR